MAEGALFFLASYILHTQLSRCNRSVSKTGNFDVSDVPPTLSEEQLEFYREWTKSDDREHILASWRNVKAKFHTYCCIQSMSYLTPRSKQLKLYSSIFDLYHKQGSIKIADVGTCFGQDTRNLILRGVPPSSIYPIDIHDGYWRAGLELFKDTGFGEGQNTQTSPLVGVNTCFFDMSLPIGDSTAIESMYLDSANSFDFVLMVAVLHTMSREQQRQSLTRVRHLLKKSSGILIGSTGGSRVSAGSEWLLTPDGSSPRFLNSVQTLRETLQEIGFSDIAVDEIPSKGWSSDPTKRPSTSQSPVGAKDRILIEFSAMAV